MPQGDKGRGVAAGMIATMADAASGVFAPLVLALDLVASVPWLGRSVDLALNLLRTGFWAALSVPDTALALAGIRPEKKLRVLVVVQRDEKGVPVAKVEEVSVQLDWAIEALGRAANVRVIPFVVTEEEASGVATLDVRGFGDGAPLANLGLPGATFQRKMIRLGMTGAPFRRASGYGAPIVLFAVRRFKGDKYNGLSFGATTDYAQVAFGMNPATLAHECGHSCMLLHRSDEGNLMHRSWPRGRHLTRWQAAVLRMSGHVTYF